MKPIVNIPIKMQNPQPRPCAPQVAAPPFLGIAKGISHLSGTMNCYLSITYDIFVSD
jgi:hypothetical protein